MQKNAFCYREAIAPYSRKNSRACAFFKPLKTGGSPGNKAYRAAYKKLLSAMKLTTMLLFVAVLQVTAKTAAQTVSYKARAVSLEKIFSAVKEQTGYLFFYDPAMLRDCKAVDVSAENQPLESFIKKVLTDQPLTYTIENKTIFISRKPVPAVPATERPFYVPILVTGRVLNLGGEPLGGATITVKSTRKGSNADANGIFTILGVEASDTLIFSYVGYKTQAIPVQNRTFIDAKMQEATSSLDEVVIQAYGRTTQRFTTGNIARISSKEISKQPVLDPILALQGRVAGLLVAPQSGYQGGPVKVEIRGRNAINRDFASDPLYILDGVPMTVLDINGTAKSAYATGAFSRGLDNLDMSRTGGQNPLFGLNPSDIESFEVLKDADATAIYGSRGANGVILITTKRGQSGKSRLTADISTGVNVVTRFWELMDTKEYLAMRREAFKNDGITPTPSNAPDLLVWDTTRYTDWQREAYGHTGKWINTQVALSGGNTQTTYRISAGYNRSTDITAISGGNSRISASAALTTRSLNQRFNLSFSNNFSYTEQTQISIVSMSTLAPNAPALYDEAGNINFKEYRGTGTKNPVEGQYNPYSSKMRSLNSSLALSYAFKGGLSAKLNLGYNQGINDQSSFTSIASQDPNPPPPTTKPTGSATFGISQNNNLNVEPMLEYNRSIGKSSLDLLLGGTYQANVSKSSSVRGTNYTSDLFIRTISAAPSLASFDLYGEYKYAGAFARIGYNYDSRYIINLNGRRDGSSRFGEDNRFGNFGSVGVAWIASEEKWIASVLPSFVSFLKLRGSYGITGSDGVGDYKYLSQFGNNNPQLLPYNGVVPLMPQILENPDFHWQQNKKLEGALDFALFDDRYNFEVAYYRNRCNNQLVAFPVPGFSGFNNVVLNSPANVQNSGWEFLVNANILKGKKWQWSANFNLGANRNTLLSYPLFEESPYYTTLKIGHSLDDRYIYHLEGVDPVTGLYIFTDINKDGVVKSNGSVPRGTADDDMYYRINTSPKFSGGMGHNISYRNFQLSMFFAFAKQLGRSAVNATQAGIMQNISKYQFDNTWHTAGQEALFAKFSTNPLSDALKYTDASGQFVDASFFRLRTLALSYAVPVMRLRKLKVSSLAINANAQNIFVLTKYKGLDPEVQSFTSMPPVRTLTMGVSVSF